jgi:DHA1 family purine ribonucleoside efflux pump-like MFS transporter
VLLVFGVANFAGTSLAAPMLNRNLKLTLALAPLALAICAAGLVAFGEAPLLAAGLIAVWGFVFGAIPVGRSTWVTRNLADDAESAGGLQVAIIQLANTCGAALGGYVLDTSGAKGPIVVGGLLLLATSFIVAVSVGSFRQRAPINVQRA